ncbi:MAG TPA: heme ABC exporter ATP-binding protein CcmA [Actinomycetota bacterium]|nr:heme ABC exporter ATP-binding protein CcmA [Actinomycetota bacterium]
MASLQHVDPSASNLRAEREERAPPAVALSSVTRVFGVVPAVVRATLTIQPGECVLIRGPNGAGKTTLLRIIATAISPTYGRGALFGFDLVEEREAIRQRTELLGHRTRLYDDLSGRENLEFTRGLFGLDRSGVQPALDRVGLADVADERVRRYSQGMRQRLALARVLLRSPELLLLDEPYAALDEEARQLVDQVIDEARSAGRTVVLATHDPTKAALANRVLFMDGGRILPELTSSTVIDGPVE